MGKNLFDQMAKKSGELRVNPSEAAWTKLEAKLNENVAKPKVKIRTLFRQLSIAAAIALLALNAYALISFLNMNNQELNADPIVLMEIPETPNAEPKIFPVSNFDKVNISEGKRNDLFINYNKSYSNSTNRYSSNLNDLVGIWTDDKQVELSIFNSESDQLFFALEDENSNKLILKAKQQGDEIIITDKKGSAFVDQIRSIEYSKDGFVLLANQKKIEIKQLDEHTIQIDVISSQTNTTKYFLNRAL